MPMSVAERRFWRWADRNPSRPNAPGMATHCWIWLGARTRDKQPRFWIDGRAVPAGSWLWQHRMVATILPGFQLYRRCRVPMCVRPSHGELRRRGSRLPKDG